MTLKTKSILISVISGTIIALFWLYINLIQINYRFPSTSEILYILKIKSGPYKDGEYQASSETPWGAVNINITVSNGQWSKIKYLQIPDSPPSQYAASDLANQALAAQGATVDGVSGATYFSDAFRDDLNQIITQSKV